MAVGRFVVTIHHPSLGGIGTNTWHLRVDGEFAGMATVMNSCTEAVRQFYEDVSGGFANATQLRYDGAISGVGADEGTFDSSDPWVVDSPSTTAPLPPANCVCVNWRGQSGDRSRRGRTFVGPMHTGSLESDGTLTGNTITVFRDAAAALVAESSGITEGALGVWSRQESVLRDFVGSSVTDKFAVLRSRRD